MKIRSYEAADEAALIALWRASDLLVNPLNDPRRDIRFCLESGHGEILVGECEGRLVASVMVGHDGHRGWIYYVATMPDLRGAGLGRRIMFAAEDRLAAKGVAKVELLVRDGNTRVIGFYQRIGYVVEPRAVLTKRLDGVGVAMGGASSDDDVTITFLEMRARPALPRIEPAGPVALLRAKTPTTAFYHYLYDAVGRAWYWTDRKQLNDEDLAAIIQDARVEIYVLHADGVPAGYFELDRRRAPTVDLAYFGIMADFIGRRLGPYLLARAIETAWTGGTERFTVNTCTLDHPRALPMYQRFGFVPYERRRVPPPWRRGDTSAYETG